MTGIQSSPKGGVILFLVIAFGFSWGLALWSYLGNGPAYDTGLAVIYMAGPSIAAVICALMYDRSRFLAALGLERNPFNIWLFWAFLTPILITIASMAVTQYFSDREYLTPAQGFSNAIAASGVDPDTLPLPIEQLALIQIISAPFVAAIVNTIVMILTEELGWRGWLWDRWSRLGFWRNALLTGFVWGLWHAPIIALFGHNYPELPILGPIIFTAWTMLISPLLALVRERGGSVVHAAMLHGVLNGVAPISLLLLADASMPWRGIVGFGGFAALAITFIIVLIVRPPRKAR